MKVRNKVLNGVRFTVKGFQALTGKISIRANDVPAGIYHVIQNSDKAHIYARGERIALKLYLPEETRFETQYNEELREIVLWIDVNEFKKMVTLWAG